MIMLIVLPLADSKVFALGGTLTQDENGVYLIYDKGDLITFSSLVKSGVYTIEGETFIDGKLMNDIIFNENVIDSTGSLINKGSGLLEFFAIGHDSATVNDRRRYSGTFDGNGKTIKGIYQPKNHARHGLFGCIGLEGVVKNLGVVDGHMSTDFVNYSNIGGVCGTNYGTIIDCYNTNTIELLKKDNKTEATNANGGGICARSEGLIKNCYNGGLIRNTGSYNNIGGICGSNRFGGTITSSFNKATVSSENERSNVGGVCAYNRGGNIEYSYNIGPISGSDIMSDENYVGGVVGYQEQVATFPTVIKNTYNTGYIAGATVNLGGICGGNIPNDDLVFGSIEECFYLNTCGSKNTLGESRNASQMKLPNFPQRLNTGVNSPAPFENDKYAQNTGYPVFKYQNKISNGDGSQTNPYQIRTVVELKIFADFVNNGQTNIHGKLMNDIIMNESVIDSNGKLINNGIGLDQWVPIGLDQYKRYSGTFDGNEKTIQGLYINASEDLQGLFASIDTSGTVKNLGLVDGYVQGESLVGGISGDNRGSIEACYNKNTIVGMEAESWVGGLSGYNRTGTIKNSYNTGMIYGGEGTTIGGITGYNGEMMNYDDKGSIINCYNTGKIESEGIYYGGICGWNISYSGVITNSYYLNTYGNNNEGTPKTEAEMKSLTFVSQINGMTTLPLFVRDRELQNNGYPVLDLRDKIASGNGTVEVPYEITTADEIRLFANLVNDGEVDIHGKLMNNIILNEGVIYTSGNLINNGKGLKPWIPIGNTRGVKFMGSFDGNGKTIRGIYINTEEKYQGLFGFIGSGAVVKNLGIVDSYIKGSYSIGALGSLNYGTISNCYNKATVTSKKGTEVGGIVAENNKLAKIDNCFNNGKIIATASSTKAGGICSRNNGSIKNTYNTGSVMVTGKDSDAVGICVYSTSGVIENCYNTGILTATEDTSRVGGISTWDVHERITNSYYLDTYGNNNIGTPKTDVEMKSTAFVAELNGTTTPAPFAKDINLRNNGYPVLNSMPLAYHSNVKGYASWSNTNDKSGITVTVKQGGSIIDEANTNRDGLFEFLLDAGTYNFIISRSGYLERTIANVNVTMGSLTNLSNFDNPISLLAGDVNGDRSINANDLSVLLAAFNKTTSDSDYNIAADLNGDGSINANDLSVLLSNFNKTASDYPTWILP